MVLDAAKGIEAQTLKLFEVCRLRSIPIITFINKVDREGRQPFELLDQVADKLALDTVPLYWPLGMGNQLEGVMNLATKEVTPFVPPGANVSADSFDFSELANVRDVSDARLTELEEEVELAAEGYPEWDHQAYLDGAMTPVFFGSALRNFGVEQLLEAVARFAPPPRSRRAGDTEIQPTQKGCTGFVFKVQANMDAKHRDRVAFLRLCSGTFERGMKLRVSSSGKVLSVRNPILFFAQDRQLADEAFAGDIIGIPNHGTIRVGDTLSEKEGVLFDGVPDFAPEILRRVRLKDPMKAKHLARALESLADEGVVQVFRARLGGQFIVGVVGQLQLEVLTTRLEQEYNVNVVLESTNYETARWLKCDDDLQMKKFGDRQMEHMMDTQHGEPVFMATSRYQLDLLEEKWSDIKFLATRERN